MTSSARTAIPSVSNVKYYVSATESSSSETITSEDFELGTNFTIELSSGTWKLTATAYYSSDSSKTAIMSGTKTITVSSSDISDCDIALSPTSTGTGTVSLKIGFDSTSTGISKMTANWTLNGTAYSKNITDGTVSAFDLLPDSNAYTEVPAGTHTVSFMFYDSSYNVKYWFSQVINVFSGMTTDTWIKGNAKYINEANNQVYITSDLVKDFATTSYYVSSSGNDTTGDGSYFAPFATLQKAADKIIAANNGTSTYSIYLLSNITIDSSTKFTTTSDTTTYGTLSTNTLCNIENTSSNALSINISSLGSAFTISGDSSTIGRLFKVNGSTSAVNLSVDNLNITKLYLLDSSSATTNYCGSVLFMCGTNDSATFGSGVTISDCVSNTSVFYPKEGTLTLNCTVKNNQSLQNGCVVRLDGSGTLKIIGGTYSGSTRTDGTSECEDLGLYGGFNHASTSISGGTVDSISTTSSDIEISGSAYVKQFSFGSASSTFNIGNTYTTTDISKIIYLEKDTDGNAITLTNEQSVFQIADSSSLSISDVIGKFEIYDSASASKKSSKYSLVADSTGKKALLELPSILYLDPTSGSDDNDGASYSSAVKTLEKAASLLNTSATSPTIYVMNEINVSSDESSSSYWTFALNSSSAPKVSLKRYDGTGGGTAFTGSLLTVASGGKVNATGIIFDGNKSSVTATAPLVDVNNGGTLTLTSCNLQNNKNTASSLASGIHIRYDSSTSYGSASLTNCNITENDGAYGGIFVKGQLYMSGGSIYKNVASNNGGGICSDGASKKVYLNGVSITENSTSANGGGFAVISKSEICLENCTVIGNTAKYGGGGSVAGTLYLFGETNISSNTGSSGASSIYWSSSYEVPIYLGLEEKISFAGDERSLSKFSLSSSLSNIEITPTEYTIGLNMLKTSKSGTLTDFINLFSVVDDDTTDSYTWYIDSDGKLQWTGGTSGSGSLSVKINDNISMSLSSSELSAAAATTLTLTAKVDGTQVDATTSNTTVALYNGGVKYADTSVTTSVSANNTITVSGAVAPGSYQLLVTFTYDGTDYQTTFDLTAADED